MLPPYKTTKIGNRSRYDLILTFQALQVPLREVSVVVPNHLHRSVRRLYGRFVLNDAERRSACLSWDRNWSIFEEQPEFSPTTYLNETESPIQTGEVSDGCILTWNYRDSIRRDWTISLAYSIAWIQFLKWLETYCPCRWRQREDFPKSTPKSSLSYHRNDHCRKDHSRRFPSFSFRLWPSTNLWT